MNAVLKGYEQSAVERDFFFKDPVAKNSATTEPISTSLGVFKRSALPPQVFFEHFFFDHSDPIFQSQTEVVSSISGLKLCETIEQTILAVPGPISNV